MKTKLAVSALLCFLILPRAPLAANSAYFQVGTNLAHVSFLHRPHTPGFQVGHYKDWRLIGSFFFCREFDLIYQKIVLYDQRVWHYPGMLSQYDIKLDMVHLVIPIFLKYALPNSIRSEVQVYGGLALHLCFWDKAGRSFDQVIDFTQDEGEDTPLPQHHMSFIEDPGPLVPLFNNSHLGYHAGVTFNLLQRHFDLRFSYGKLYQVDAVEIDHAYKSLSLFVALGR